MDQTRTGALIRALRQQKHLTQRQLADTIGVSDKAVSKWERGCGAPDISLLPRLSQALGTSAEALLRGDLEENDLSNGNMKRVRVCVCPHCGSRLNPGARFCTVCGTRVPEAPQGQTDWYASAPGGAVSSPEIGAKHKPKKLLIGLLCGFAALVVIAAVLIGLFAAHGGSHGTTGNTEVDQLIERYFTYFENDDISGMNKIFLPEAVAFMRDDDDGLLTVEEAIEELDDWYDDYGRTIDDYDIYDSDRLDEEDLTQLEWALDVRIDDNLVVACDVTYAGGADEDFYFEFVQVSGQWYLLFAMD